MEVPFYTLKELAQIMGYKNVNSIAVAIQKGACDIPTYKVAGKRVADKEVVAAWFQNRRAEGLRKVGDLENPLGFSAAS